MKHLNKFKLNEEIGQSGWQKLNYDESDQVMDLLKQAIYYHNK